MKQNISSVQLQCLSNVARSKLRRWIGRSTSNFEENWDNKVGLPLLSIGQMIEFLDEARSYDMRINRQKTIFGNKWEFAYGMPYNHGDNYDELCDALWEAVKAVLEQPSK